MSINKVSGMIIVCGLVLIAVITSGSSKLPHYSESIKEGRPINSQIAIVYSSQYKTSFLGLEKFHPFDLNKYEHIYEGLINDSLISDSDIFVPIQISNEQILLVHTDKFVSSLNSFKTIANYLEAPQLLLISPLISKRRVLKPFKFASGGTLLAAEKALEYGIGINIGGGYHHAKPDKGEGFCIFADIPIAIRVLQTNGTIQKALVIDLDVHQGNGTAVCFSDDESIFTFSMHQENIYPIPKEISDLDIELHPGMDDDKYLEILANIIPELFKKIKPDVVFIVGGCDTLEGDQLGSLNMTEAGIVKRDWIVIEACLSRKIPVVFTLAGGYSENAWHAQYLSIKNIIEKTGLNR